MTQHSKAEVVSFVQQWVARHVPEPAAPPNLAEVDRLAAHLTGDARAHGISGGDIHRALGDIDDYLSEHCRRGAA